MVTVARSRVLVRYIVLILASYLTIDTATPLLPGAFRFDPRESVDAGGRPNAPTIVLTAVAWSSEPGPVGSDRVPRTVGSVSRRRVTPRFLLILHPADPGRSSPAPDDD